MLNLAGLSVQPQLLPRELVCQQAAQLRGVQVFQ